LKRVGTGGVDRETGGSRTLGSKLGDKLIQLPASVVNKKKKRILQHGEPCDLFAYSGRSACDDDCGACAFLQHPVPRENHRHGDRGARG
jgi:hypothetical protein